MPHPLRDRSAHQISWSRNGFIAYADLTDTTNLSITKLESIKGSQWRLAPKNTYTVKPPSQTHLRPIQSVHWSPAGAELAIIDEVGCVTIIGAGVVRVGTQHQISSYEDVDVLYQDDVGKCDGASILKGVAFKWLNVDKPIIAASPAMASGEKYTYAVHQYKSYGCLHPVPGKTGCILVRKNGVLDLYYQNVGNMLEFQKTSVTLEKETWFDQASVGYLRDGSIIVATYCPMDHALRVYKLTIDWGSNPQTKLQPVFKVERLICEKLNRVGKNGLMLELDRVEIVSPNFALESDLDILMSFTGPGVLGKTLLQKYQISTEYKNLRFKSDMGSVEGYPNLVLIGEDTLQDEILDIGFKNFDFIVVVITTKGKVQLRSRKMLALHRPSASSITSMLDTGYKFESPESDPEAMSVSPSLAGYVRYSKGELTFHGIKKINPEWQQKEILTVAAGIASVVASTGYTNTDANELIAVIQSELSTIPESMRMQFITTVLRESHLAINFTLDYSKDQIDKLLVSPPLQRLLGLQYSIGKFAPTNEQSCIAQSLLNLRLVSFSIMLSLRTLYHLQQRIAKKGNIDSVGDAVFRAESLLSAIGPINWLMELFIFSIQELLDVTVDPSHKTIVVSLFLAKIPRSLMTYSISGIKRIDMFISKMEENYRVNRQNPLNAELLAKSIERFRMLMKTVNLDQLERFFGMIDQSLPDNKAMGPATEQSLIFENKIPQVYSSHANAMVQKFLSLFENQPMSDIYFQDTTWLNLKVKPNKIPTKVVIPTNSTVPPVVSLSKDIVDDITKTVITNKEKLKKCLRCDSIRGNSENDGFNLLGRSLTMGVTHWPVAFHKTCLCGSCWVYLRPNECGI